MWKPIGTAPKDGNWIFILPYADSPVAIRVFWWTHWGPDIGFWTDGLDDGDGDVRAIPAELWAPAPEGIDPPD